MTTETKLETKIKKITQARLYDELFIAKIERNSIYVIDSRQQKNLSSSGECLDEFFDCETIDGIIEASASFNPKLLLVKSKGGYAVIVCSACSVARFLLISFPSVSIPPLFSDYNGIGVLSIEHGHLQATAPNDEYFQPFFNICDSLLSFQHTISLYSCTGGSESEILDAFSRCARVLGLCEVKAEPSQSDALISPEKLDVPLFALSFISLCMIARRISLDRGITVSSAYENEIPRFTVSFELANAARSETEIAEDLLALRRIYDTYRCIFDFSYTDGYLKISFCPELKDWALLGIKQPEISLFEDGINGDPSFWDQNTLDS